MKTSVILVTMAAVIISVLGLAFADAGDLDETVSSLTKGLGN